MVFNRLWDVQIFVHNPGEEMWLLLTDFPHVVQNIRLPIQSDPEITLIKLLLNELKTTQINRDHLPCKNYNDELEFIVVRKVFGNVLDLESIAPFRDLTK